ncbi:hypothetical protein [Acidisphaera rubrifaciens]|uniref:hypothetical protein n=1 Tax=Acidisphaera rubrifaciens TaxID=50715 RepID=UPI0011DD213B|nr:hypothetical protein [Acidisphaera rubrifaciens]
MRNATLLLLFCFAACAGAFPKMLPGQIYSKNGTMLQFQIERAYRTGSMQAFNAATGEQFKGQYVGIIRQQTAVSFGSGSANTNYFSLNRGGSANTSVFGNQITNVSSNIAEAKGFLRGDRGTILNCQMTIETGLMPHGLGVCTDNHNADYQLQF